MLTEIEWRIKPLLEKWADVASYDAPGVGDEPRPPQYAVDAITGRGLDELDRRGWERCVIVGDEYGGYAAIQLAAADPDRVAGLAVGHACLSFRTQGERAPLNGEVMAALMGLGEIDFRSYARALSQATQDAYDDQTADRFLERVSQEVMLAYLPSLRSASEGDMEPLLRGLGRPLLLAEHEGCLGWTAEGFEDAAAAFPEAATASMQVKCSASPDFAEALEEFCAALDWD